MLNKLYIIIIIIILIIIVIKVQYYFKTIEEFTTEIYVTDDRKTGKYGITCTSCPGNCTAGNYITGSCLNNTITENKSCTPCKSSCPAGKTLSGHCNGTSTSDKQCTPCPSGQYKSGDNVNECSLHISTCGSGKGLYGTNSTTSTKTCTPCPIGTYKSGDNGNECSPHISTCGSGKGLYGLSNNAKRTMTCYTCPGGTYKIGDNGNRCINCADGKEPNDDKTDCIDCPIGTAGMGGHCPACESGKEPNEAKTGCEPIPITGLYSFGNNPHGELGVGDNDHKYIPTFIEKYYYISSNINYDEITIIEISAGAHHSLFLTNEGRVYSCGNDEMGQIGLGNTGYKNIPTLIQNFNKNTLNINYDKITIIEISAGGYHSLFLTDGGDVYSCGHNSSGQLGLGNNDDQNIPILIEGVNNIRKISTGDHHSLFLTNEGRVYSSGFNSNGQLGLDHTINQKKPILIQNFNNNTSIINNHDITIIEISTGRYHNLFLTDDGYVYSCGRNNTNGQLGLGNYHDKNIPTLIQNFNNNTSNINTKHLNNINIRKISAGGDHSLFLTDDGYVYSCGLNDKGQLGLGPSNTDDKNIPTLIKNFYNNTSNINYNKITIIEISAGRYHSLFLTDDGYVYSCGYNYSGQLGLGPSNTDDKNIPTLIEGVNNITKISSGGYYSIFYKGSIQSQESIITRLYSSGYNSNGQLGLGPSNTDDKNIPTFIENFYYISSYINYDEITIIEISAGAHHSLFLTNEGRVYSCGDDEWGQIGLGDDFYDNRPTLIQNFNNNTSYIKYDEITIIEISAGGYHNLFLTDDGYVYSCGYNDIGQLGIGDNDNKNIPTLIQNFNKNTLNINYDKITIIEISAGDHHSLFLTSAGQVYSCGYNNKGQLGVGNTDDKNIPTLIENIYNINSYINSKILNITQISAGGYHNLFLTDDGHVYSCGYNKKGQLGLGNTDDKNIPTPILFFNNNHEITIIEISAGGHHSLFLTDDGYVYSCGRNHKGQLGLGNTDDKNIPTPILFFNNNHEITIIEISAGRYHSLFLTDDGYVYSCGYNLFGQLGVCNNDNQLGVCNNDNQNIPTLIEGVNNITKISSGGYHSLFYNESIREEEEGDGDE
jgi:alpha-tubulin suppressor-like RCC1 family protein